MRSLIHTDRLSASVTMQLTMATLTSSAVTALSLLLPEVITSKDTNNDCSSGDLR